MSTVAPESPAARWVIAVLSVVVFAAAGTLIVVTRLDRDSEQVAVSDPAKDLADQLRPFEDAREERLASPAREATTLRRQRATPDPDAPTKSGAPEVEPATGDAVSGVA